MTPDKSIDPDDNGSAERRFDRLLGYVRRGWWTRRVLEALAVVAGLAVLLVAVALAWMAGSLFEGGTVANARAAVYVGIPLLLLVILLPRLVRRLSRREAAHYVEARSGDLDALLVSAVEVGERRPPAADGSLAELLFDQAAAACERGPVPARALERLRLRRAGLALAAIVLVGAGLAWWGSGPLRHGLGLVLAPAADPAAGSPYRLGVAPGDRLVVAGEDLAISGLPENFRPQAVELLTRVPGDDGWRVRPMTPAAQGDAFEALLFNIEGPYEYYLRSGPVESTRHRVEVTPRPQVSRIDLRYEFPPHTGRPPELVRDGGAIRAVRGTRVEIRAVPDRPLSGGELVIDDTRRIPLTMVDGELRATVELAEDGHYRIELPAGRAGPVAASAEHAIQVHADDRPRVVLEWPGRDTRVTAIEEIDIALRAEDDVAVRDVELVLNINGGEEQVIRFASDPAHPELLQARHPLALEEIELAPGDMISYYARVRDAPDDAERMVSTDLYFMDVRPFEKRFRPAQGGGGGGGGGGQGEAELTAQQRALLVALFKLKRDRRGLDPALFAERVTTLAEAQARIRDRVEAIVRRVRARNFIAGNDGYQRMAEELPRAAQAMVDVESRLSGSELDGALPSARRALLHMQRADAAFRDVQVAMARSQGGQGGGAQQELANLFQLEMDKFRNQYENLQRGRWNEPNRAIDDALAKLRELARRQQREIERTRLRGQGDGDPNSQQALAEELEKLMRDLERLTRHRDPKRAEQARRSLDELKAARQAMQRAGGNGDGAAGREALERLRGVQRELERSRPGRLASGIDEALEQAEAALERQREIARQLAEVVGDPRGVPIDQLHDLVKGKQELAGDAQGLGGELERLREQARADLPAVADQLDDAGRALRERRLDERLRRSATALSRDPIGYPVAGEREFEQEFENLRQRLARAGQSLREAVGPDREQQLERLRALVRGMSADRQRLADAANRGGRAGSGRESGGGSAPGSAPGATAGGGPNGPSGPGGPGWGGGSDYSVDFSALRDQLIERMRAVTALGDRFGDLGHVAEDVAAVIDAIDALGATPDAGELDALRRRQAALLAGIQQLEAGLRVAEEGGAGGAVVRRAVTVAPRYQALVERYFRNLSEEAWQSRHE